MEVVPPPPIDFSARLRSSAAGQKVGKTSDTLAGLYPPAADATLHVLTNPFGTKKYHDHKMFEGGKMADGMVKEPRLAFRHKS